MINLFFIVHNYSGAETYARELTNYLACQDDVSLYMIFANNPNYKEFTIQKKGNVTSIYIPPQISSEISSIYYRRTVQLLSCYYSQLKNVVIHANMPEQIFLANEIRNLYVICWFWDTVRKQWVRTDNT